MIDYIKNIKARIETLLYFGSFSATSPDLRRVGCLHGSFITQRTVPETLPGIKTCMP